MSNNSLKNRGFIGFETFYNNMRMIFKMQSKIILVLILLQLSLCIALFIIMHSKTELSIMISYVKSYFVFNKDNITKILIDNQFYEITYSQLRDTYTSRIVDWLKAFTPITMYTFAIFILFIPINIFFYKRSEWLGKSKHIKGSKLITSKELNSAIKIKKKDIFLPFGEVFMPVERG